MSIRTQKEMDFNNRDRYIKKLERNRDRMIHAQDMIRERKDGRETRFRIQKFLKDGYKDDKSRELSATRQ